MLTVYVCVAMLLALACTGGSLARLATVRLRRVWLLWAALADQIVVISVLPTTNVTVLALAHVASYLAAGACVVANRRLQGVWLIGLGGALNGLVISVNGGTLPASESAVRAAGQVAETGRFTNSEVLAHPRLPWLGDVFATPVWLPGHNVFSLGDVAIWVGLMIFLWRTCRSGAKPMPRHEFRLSASSATRTALSVTSRGRARHRRSWWGADAGRTLPAAARTTPGGAAGSLGAAPVAVDGSVHSAVRIATNVNA